jgi:hypothetical protein
MYACAQQTWKPEPDTSRSMRLTRKDLPVRYRPTMDAIAMGPFNCMCVFVHHCDVSEFDAFFPMKFSWLEHSSASVWLVLMTLRELRAAIRRETALQACAHDNS